MELSATQLITLKSKVFAKISRELDIANDDNELDLFLNKYQIIFEKEAMPVDTKRMKILVLGALSGRIKDFQLAAKKLGVPEDNIEFVDDYDRLTNFSVVKLQYSNVYSDIIYGPNPHKQKDMGDTSSFVAEIKRNPEKYPRLNESIANDKYKISISSFKNAILSSRYFEAKSEN